MIETSSWKEPLIDLVEMRKELAYAVEIVNARASREIHNESGRPAFTAFMRQETGELDHLLCRIAHHVVVLETNKKAVRPVR